MSTFTGTASAETITPSTVSQGVKSDPPGSTPSAASDTIDGGAGNDTLAGGTGDDVIYGGNPDYIFVPLRAEYIPSGGDLIFPEETIPGFGGPTVNRTGLGDYTIGNRANGQFQYTGLLGDGLFGTAGTIDTSGISRGGSTGVGDESREGVTNFTMIDDSPFGFGGDLIPREGYYIPVLGGDDSILGGAGNDTIFGQSGTDTIEGGAGADEIDGGEDGDIIYGDSANALDSGGLLPPGPELTSFTASATAANRNTFNTVLDAPQLFLLATIPGTDQDDTLPGLNTEGDNITGGAGNDTIHGQGGDDTIYGGADNDTISGGTGDDIISGDGGQDTIHGGADDDYIDGGSESDTIVGDGGDDTLIGGGGDDRLIGGSDDDVIEGGPGADQIDGGSENDTASYTKSTGAVQVDLRNPAGATGGDAAGDRLIQIENLRGSNHADTLTGNDQANEIKGGKGNDTIVGESGENTLYGDGGSDSIKGSDNDSIVGGNDKDVIEGGGGNDTIIGGDGVGQSLKGDGGDDEITGGKDRDFIEGGNGNDTINGGGGIDVIQGDGGIDDETGDDLINGGAENDTISGGSGNDTIDGGPGKDSLTGDKDDDGSVGRDVFVFLQWQDSQKKGNYNGDNITDFVSGVDKIDISAIVEAIHGQNVDFIGTNAFTKGGAVEIRHDPDKDQIQIDLDNNGQFNDGDFEINKISSIVEADLTLIS